MSCCLTATRRLSTAYIAGIPTKPGIGREPCSTLCAAAVGRRPSSSPTPSCCEQQLHEFAAQREQLVPLIEHCYAAWLDHLHSRGALDYDELLLAALRLLRDNPHIAQRFDVLMVDEFQDTNRPQLELLEAAQTAFRRTTVVGDPRQAIYGWNSARAELIRSFPFGPPGAEHPLTVNYRSHPAIVALANLALAGSELAGEAPLEPLSGMALDSRGAIDPRAASLHLLPGVEDEAHFVAANIVRLHDAGVPYSAMAVLLRSRTRLPELLAALRESGIPTLAAGGAGLYLDIRVRLTSSLLRLIADPLDEAAATHVLESPLVGLPPGVLAARIGPDGGPDPGALLRDPDLLPAAWTWRAAARKQLARLADLLHEARLRIDLLNPGEYVEWLWRAGGMLQLAWPGEPVEARLLLRRMQRDADAWAETHPGAGIAGWAALLEHNIREQPRVPLPVPPAVDAVPVTTVHQAKGREWPVVFVYNTQLPSRRAGAIDSVLWDERWKLVISGARNDEALGALRADLRRRQRNEERSIWYVALTRARERLFVLHSGCVYSGGFADAAAKLARITAGEPLAPEDEAVHFFHELWELLRADADGLGAVVPCSVDKEGAYLMSTPIRPTRLIEPYGGHLIDLVVSGAELAEHKAYAGTLPSIQMSERSVCDFEMLVTGAFSPLDRFMGYADYRGVLEHMRLAGGHLFPIPVTLPVDAEAGVDVGSEIALRNGKNELLGSMVVEEIYAWDPSEEAGVVLGTTDSRHPLVAEMRHWGKHYISGPIRALQVPGHHDFQDLRITPAQARTALEQRGRENVVAFQTCAPLHRAQEELTRWAIEQVDGVLLLHSLAGLANQEKVDHFTRVRTHLSLANTYFERERIVLGLLPLATRMAGPREVLWHAVIDRNYGANYVIVDRAGSSIDQAAGPGSRTR